MEIFGVFFFFGIFLSFAVYWVMNFILIRIILIALIVFLCVKHYNGRKTIFGIGVILSAEIIHFMVKQLENSHGNIYENINLFYVIGPFILIFLISKFVKYTYKSFREYD